MGQKVYDALSGVLFAIVALAHLLRIIQGWSIQVDTTTVPMGVSWGGFVAAALLAWWALRLAAGTGRSGQGPSGE